MRLKLHSAVLDLHTHVMSIQMWICWPVFPSSSLNCLFLHHCARFLFLSFSCCFLIIVSTSSPEFTGSLFLVLSPHHPPPHPPALCLVERIHFRFLMLQANACDTVHHFPLHSSCFLPLLPHYYSAFLMFSAPNLKMLCLYFPLFFLMHISSVQQENYASG